MIGNLIEFIILVAVVNFFLYMILGRFSFGRLLISPLTIIAAVYIGYRFLRKR
jgi:hypothetical protein